MKKTETVAFPSTATWAKLVNRWATAPECGEKRLLCAVIAGAIDDDYRRAKSNGMSLSEPADLSLYFRRGFLLHARLIGLGADFLIEQVIRAAGMVGKELEVEA